MVKPFKRGRGSSFDDFLKKEGIYEETQAIAMQLQQVMTEQNLSKNKMAQRMQTSRAQLDQLLDPNAGNVTLETLQRAAGVLGKVLRLELV